MVRASGSSGFEALAASGAQLCPALLCLLSFSRAAALSLPGPPCLCAGLSASPLEGREQPEWPRAGESEAPSLAPWAEKWWVAGLWGFVTGVCVGPYVAVTK